MKLKLAACLVVGLVIGAIGGYYYGRQYGDLRAYAIGLEQGINEGTANAMIPMLNWWMFQLEENLKS